MSQALKIPRQVRSREARERILTTALQLLEDQGYPYVTVNNICRAASISTGSFYHHFGSKDELLAHYYAAAYERYAEQFKEVCDRDIVKTLVGIYELHAAFCRELGVDFMRGFYSPMNKGLSARPGPDSGAAVNRPLLDKTCEQIALAKERDYIPPSVEPRELAMELCMISKSCVYEWCLCDGMFNLEGHTCKMITTYMQGVVTRAYREEYLA